MSKQRKKPDLQTKLVEFSFEPMIVWASDDGIIEWSPGCERLYGFTRDEAVGRSIHNLLDTIHPLPIEQFMLELAAKGEWIGELHHTTKDGRKVVVESRQQIAQIGKRRLVLETDRDITALRLSEHRLREALRIGGMGYLDWNLVTNEIEWSPETYQLFGHVRGGAFSPTIETMVGMVPSEDRPYVEERLQAVIRGAAPYDIVHRMVRPDGQVIYVHAQGEVIRDEHGRALRMLGTVHDVTELTNRQEALCQREERLAFLLRLNDALRPLSDPLDIQEVAARLLGEHLRVNRAGYAEIEGDQYIIRREYVNGVRPLAGRGPTSTFGSGMREVYRRGELVAVNDVSTDSRFSDRDRALYLGNQIAALVGVMLLKDGRLVAAFGVNTSTPRIWTQMEGQLIREVAERTWAAVERAHAEAELRTAHETLERRVQERTAELESRNAQLRRLASDLILAEQRAREGLANTLHDHFQQLLYSATLKLDRAARRDPKGAQVGLLQQARANISEAIEAARTLSVDLFSPRLHEGGLPAALAWLAKRTQQQYGITVNVTADAGANPEAKDVRTLIFESVRELLFNVVKHAQVDRVDIDLVFGPGDTIHLHVTDQGVGFDPAVVLDHRHQIGLGLFSIQERLALLGGRLDIQSAPGKGTRFSLIIPRGDLLAFANPAVATPTAGSVRQERLVSRASASHTAKPLRILIADDHAVLREGLRELFSERPELQVVAEATNGVEAISLAMSQHPDVIVMDVSMPQMDGIEATRQIHAALPHIEIVGLSTYVDENIERSMREAGAKAYFTKNESSDRLLDYLLSFRPQAKGSA